MRKTVQLTTRLDGLLGARATASGTFQASVILAALTKALKEADWSELATHKDLVMPERGDRMRSFFMPDGYGKKVAAVCSTSDHALTPGDVIRLACARYVAMV